MDINKENLEQTEENIIIIYRDFNYFYKAIENNLKSSFFPTELIWKDLNKLSDFQKWYLTRYVKDCFDTIDSFITSYLTTIDSNYPNYEDFYFLKEFLSKLRKAYYLNGTSLNSVFENSINAKQKFYKLCQEYLFENFNSKLSELSGQYPTGTVLEETRNLKNQTKVKETVKTNKDKIEKAISKWITRIK
jgi:hypothetical protein